MRARLASLTADAILWIAVACATAGAVFLVGAFVDTIAKAATP